MIRIHLPKDGDVWQSNGHQCWSGGGGGLGFYLKETYFLRVKEKKCAELEGELQELVRTRKNKEELLRTRRNESNGD